MIKEQWILTEVIFLCHALYSIRNPKQIGNSSSSQIVAYSFTRLPICYFPVYSKVPFVKERVVCYSDLNTQRPIFLDFRRVIRVHIIMAHSRIYSKLIVLHQQNPCFLLLRLFSSALPERLFIMALPR